MPTIVQFRRGTEAQSDAFTGNVGELSVDTTNETVRVHDGSTAGGSRLATYAEVADRMQVANVQSLITTSINNVIDSAPGTLDTLNELAAAIGDDADFLSKIQANVDQKLGATASVTLSGDVTGTASFSANAVTITTTIADDSHNHVISNVDGLQAALDAKASLTGAAFTGAITTTSTFDGRDVATDGSKLDGIETNATADQTASEILTAVKTVDGAASGLDADLLDGQHGSHYLDWTNTTNKPDPTITLGGDLTGSITLTDLAGGTLTAAVVDNSHNHSSSSGAFTVGTDLTVSGGDIILSGTGRIQGVDTVTLGTDAANKTYVDNAVAGVVDSAPAALDTLNELAAALGDDASFSTTVTTSIGQKLAKASNLSDLTNASTARTNLGLGTAAVVDATSAATANKVVQRDGSGNFSANIVTAVDFNATSDETMKTNITTIASSLEKLGAIRGVNFNWKKDDRYAMGVIAQEVEAVVPEVVREDEEGLRSVNYGALVGLLIEAVKDLKNEIEELKRR